MNLRSVSRAYAPLVVGAALLVLPGCNKKEIAALQQQNSELTKARDQLQLEKTALAAEKARNEENMRGSLLNKNSQLTQRETELSNLNQNLSNTEQDLASKNARIAEMQRILDQKEAATRALRQRVADALLGFNAQDLQVNVKNGKVYVSLSEQLLFKSGSTKVDPKGQDALKKLATALQGNKDLNVLVEGHTDNVPIKGQTASGAKDNWDLSVIAGHRNHPHPHQRRHGPRPGNTFGPSRIPPRGSQRLAPEQGPEPPHRHHPDAQAGRAVFHLKPKLKSQI